MPRTVRELKAQLRAAGFLYRPGKGSHTVWTHPLYPGRITVASKDSDDARLYLEREVDRAIETVSNAQDEQSEDKS